MSVTGQDRPTLRARIRFGGVSGPGSAAGLGDGCESCVPSRGPGCGGGGVVTDGRPKTTQHRIRTDGEEADIGGNPEAEFQEGGEQDDQAFLSVHDPGGGAVALWESLGAAFPSSTSRRIGGGPISQGLPAETPPVRDPRGFLFALPALTGRIPIRSHSLQNEPFFDTVRLYHHANETLAIIVDGFDHLRAVVVKQRLGMADRSHGFSDIWISVSSSVSTSARKANSIDA